MKTITKSILSVSAAAIVLASTLTPAFVSAWGNNGGAERPTYTIQDINDGKLGKNITFNSITNGTIGDERNFVGALPSSEVLPLSSQDGLGTNKNVWHANEIELKDGEKYTIRLYVHNNASYNALKDEATARDVVAHYSLPTTVGQKLTVIGYIDSPNATPTRYWDEVDFVAPEGSNDSFYLKYVPGSAKYTNMDDNDQYRTFSLPDEIIVGANTTPMTGGAKLGYNQMDGNIPGCFEYSGQVTIEVEAHKSVTATVEKKVRMKGTKEWTEALNAKVGDEVEYQIKYVNLLNEQVDNVIIRDILPNNIEYVPGSTMLYNSNYKDGLAVDVDNLVTTGINIGSSAVKANSYIRFTGKVVDKSLECGTNQLVNWANATVNGAVANYDDASVVVNKICADQPKPAATETPKTIVETGPTGIAAGAIAAGSLTTAAGYFIASRKKLV